MTVWLSEPVERRIVAVVGEDGLVEVGETPARDEVRAGGEPGGGADATDDEHVGEGAAARAAGPGRDEVRERERRGRGGHDRLVEGAEREQAADREHAPGARLTPGTDEEGQCPDDARVDEDLGIGLIGLQPQIAGDERPEHGTPEPSGDPADRGGGGVDTEERGDRGGHVEKVDRTGALAHEQDRERVGHVDRGRLVVPYVGVQRATGDQLLTDHRRRGDVALQGLVVGVEPRDRDEERERAEHDDDQGPPGHGHHGHLRRNMPELARTGSK